MSGNCWYLPASHKSGILHTSYKSTKGTSQVDVFISWSGYRSKAVAELLKEWLKCVLQASEPWVSSKDIDRGSMWFTEVSEQLNNASIGIICLSRDNLDKPWILFEAGALAKGLSSSRVCTFLIDLEPTDIRDPLAQFNHTLPDQDGVFNLVKTLNKQLGKRSLGEEVINRVFNTYWPQFESDYQKILKDHPLNPDLPKRSEDSIMSEMLTILRKIERQPRSAKALDPELGSAGMVTGSVDFLPRKYMGITELDKHKLTIHKLEKQRAELSVQVKALKEEDEKENLEKIHALEEKFRVLEWQIMAFKALE